jgi:hypothetical protein
MAAIASAQPPVPESVASITQWMDGLGTAVGVEVTTRFGVTGNVTIGVTEVAGGDETGEGTGWLAQAAETLRSTIGTSVRHAI